MRILQKKAQIPPDSPAAPSYPYSIPSRILIELNAKALPIAKEATIEGTDPVRVYARTPPSIETPDIYVVSGMKRLITDLGEKIGSLRRRQVGASTTG